MNKVTDYIRVHLTTTLFNHSVSKLNIIFQALDIYFIPGINDLMCKACGR